jgi:glutathione S-transferase
VVPPQSLVLIRCYRIPFSTNVERVALALAFKGLAAEPVDIDPADRSLVEQVSGQSLTPVLENGDEVIADSTRILEWLEDHHLDPPLYPTDPARRAEVELLVDWFNRVWKGPPNLINDERAKPAPDSRALSRWGTELTHSRERFEALLSGREFLAGDRLTVFDVVAFPFLKYAGLAPDPTDTDPFHAVLHEHLSTTRHPRLLEWIARMDELPRTPA